MRIFIKKYTLKTIKKIDIKKELVKRGHLGMVESEERAGLRRGRPVRVPKHGFEASGKVIGETARVVFLASWYERCNSQ